MPNHPENSQIIEKIKALHRQRRELLDLAPEKALDRILESAQPAALVHSFPEQDFYFLVHDLGPEDARPLLALASDRQCEYLLDVEVWQKDRLDLARITRWIDLLTGAAPERFIRWLVRSKPDLLAYYLFKSIEVRVRDHDQDPAEFGPAFFTCDDTFYIKILDASPGEGPAPSVGGEEKAAFLSGFLKRLAAYDYSAYRQALLSAGSVLPAELEEESFRLRNVRLAEKGFLPFDQAVGIYQPLKAGDLTGRSRKRSVTATSERELPVPAAFYSTDMFQRQDLFSQSLTLLASDAAGSAQVQVEFAGLCNRIIAADQNPVRERKELRKIVAKGCGFVSLGLEQIMAERFDRSTAGSPLQAAAVLLKTVPLADLFRVGYGLALDLKWRAQKWYAKSWFGSQGLPLAFWNEAWLGCLGGLLIQRPLFFDNYATGDLYREFDKLEDITTTGKVLDQIIAVDSLFDRMALTLAPFPDRMLTYQNLLLTLWARDTLDPADRDRQGPMGRVSPQTLTLTVVELKSFFNQLFSRDTADARIGDTMKEAFAVWVARRTGLADYQVSDTFGHIFETLFDELESEYGKVAVKDLNARYIPHFVVAETAP